MISALLWVALAAEPAKGDVSGAAKAAAEQAAQLKRAGDEAKVKCAPLETQPLEPEAEAKVGESVAAQLKKQQGALLTGDVADYVQSVGDKLAKLSARPALGWKFEVLQNEAPKVQSAPGGRVLLTTGVLAALSNEAQLAAVLAHEIVHVTSHLPAALSRGRRQSCEVMAAHGAAGVNAGLPKELAMDNAMLGSLQEQTLQVTVLSGLSLDDELAADAAALELLKKGGYAQSELGRVIERVPMQTMGLTGLPAAAKRLEALGPAAKAGEGKKPPFPKKLSWPK